MKKSSLLFCQLAQKIFQASGFWERKRLSEELIQKIQYRLTKSDDSSLEEALNFLADEMPAAHDILADLVEAASEKPKEKQAFKNADCQLIAIPILAWSRYSLPFGKLENDFLRDFSALLFKHNTSPQIQHIVLADVLFAPDELPQNFETIAKWSHLLSEKFLQHKGQARYSICDFPSQNEEENDFLSDVRFVVALLVAPKNAPFFVWETDPKLTRDAALHIWQTESKKLLDSIFIGAHYESLLPSSFNAACRESDLKSRSYSLNAAISFLKTTLNILPEQMRVIVAYCFNKENEEYRISLATRNGHILYGVVWPMLPGENDEDEALLNIQQIAKNHRILDFTFLPERQPIEFCDDCGLPLFPNLSGEFLHPQMPQNAPMMGESVLN